MQREFIGTLMLGNEVDITDPCYDKNVWCRMTKKCQPGEYYGYADISDEGDWGMRVVSISIYKDDEKVSDDELYVIGNIGVDAGLAGFFNNKQDFKDDEWNEFCSKLDFDKTNYWNMYNGLFSESGYGDGSYNVYANEERTAFQIVFIDDEEEEE